MALTAFPITWLDEYVVDNTGAIIDFSIFIGLSFELIITIQQNNELLYFKSDSSNQA